MQQASHEKGETVTDQNMSYVTPPEEDRNYENDSVFTFLAIVEAVGPDEETAKARADAFFRDAFEATPSDHVVSMMVTPTAVYEFGDVAGFIRDMEDSDDLDPNRVP